MGDGGLLEKENGIGRCSGVARRKTQFACMSRVAFLQLCNYYSDRRLDTTKMDAKQRRLAGKPYLFRVKLAIYGIPNTLRTQTRSSACVRLA